MLHHTLFDFQELWLCTVCLGWSSLYCYCCSSFYLIGSFLFPFCSHAPTVNQYTIYLRILSLPVNSLITSVASMQYFLDFKSFLVSQRTYFPVLPGYRLQMTLAKVSTLFHLSHCSPCLGCHTRCFLGLHSVLLTLNPLNPLFTWVAWGEGQEVIEHGQSPGCKTPPVRNIFSCALCVAISSHLKTLTACW